jgi:hypothetical protein
MLSAITAEYKCPMCGAESNGQHFELDQQLVEGMELAKFTCVGIENGRRNIEGLRVLPSTLKNFGALAG